MISIFHIDDKQGYARDCAEACVHKLGDKHDYAHRVSVERMGTVVTFGVACFHFSDVTEAQRELAILAALSLEIADDPEPHHALLTEFDRRESRYQVSDYINTDKSARQSEKGKKKAGHKGTLWQIVEDNYEIDMTIEDLLKAMGDDERILLDGIDYFTKTITFLDKDKNGDECAKCRAFGTVANAMSKVKKTLLSKNK
jgi:hypothetical protein